jgi:type II secretory pathway pseudopilin PulG
MTKDESQDGITLIEAVVAASILLTLAGGVAHLFLLTHRFALGAERMTVAVAAAASRLDALSAIPWQYDLAGAAPDVAALALSPADALDRDIAGLSDRLDATGSPLAGVDAGQPAFVRRWALLPSSGDPTTGRGIEVCVFAWPAAPGVAPMACLASVRTRQP